jgi:hypothetical protein
VIGSNEPGNTAIFCMPKNSLIFEKKNTATA